jgi:hypothetical protein
MQLFRSKANDMDPQEFWRQTGERRGGEVGYRTFATFLGIAGESPLGLPGLLYRVGDVLWFEDFEKDNWLARILSSKKSFQKTEVSFRVDEVAFTRVVSRRAASRAIAGSVAPGDLRPMPGLVRSFAASVLQVGLSNGTSLFFEVMLQAGLIAQLKKA